MMNGFDGCLMMPLSRINDFQQISSACRRSIVSTIDSSLWMASLIVSDV
jgi:hypothetical protein